MLVDFTVSNFKSIKNEQTLSLSASAFKEYKENLFENPNKSDIELYLLKFAAIYGANGSGKSNLLKALGMFRNFILNSTDAKLNEEIKFYFPYKFDVDKKNSPIKMEIEFINSDKIRYRYYIVYSRLEILEECLYYYPKGQEAKLFERKSDNKIEFGDSLKGEKKIIEKQLLKNVLFLSKAANSNNKQLEIVYEFFQSLLILVQGNFQYDLPIDMNYHIFKPNQLANLLNAFDTGIKKVDFKKDDSPEIEKFLNLLIEKSYDGESNINIWKEKYEQFKFKPDFIHDSYKGEEKIGSETLKLNEESIGTQKLYSILGLLFTALKKGGTIILDEINNSFHTHLTKFLIEIFQKNETNKNNAQLIFTTHDTTILDYRLFRRDQIWFTEKDIYGATSLYSLIEFKNNNLRPDTPIEKWYLSGRFGALPIFNDLKLLEEDAEAKENPN